jgi:PhnB protein
MTRKGETMATRKSAATKRATGRLPAKKTTAKRTGAKKPPRKQVKGVPQGYHAVTAYLCVDGAADAIDFYKRAFGAMERFRMDAPGGRIGHAEIVIADCPVMLADPFPEMDFRAPAKGERPPVNMHLYVPDVDAMVANAVEAGATVIRAIEDKFYGDRSGTIEDPFGHVWHLATHKEDLSPAEMKRRAGRAKKGKGD